MEQELWLARSEDEGSYGIFRGEPSPSELEYFAGLMSEDDFKSGKHGLLDYYCPEVFHALTTARLRKGRKRKIKRILIELED